MIGIDEGEILRVAEIKLMQAESYYDRRLGRRCPYGRSQAVEDAIEVCMPGYRSFRRILEGNLGELHAEALPRDDLGELAEHSEALVCIIRKIRNKLADDLMDRIGSDRLYKIMARRNKACENTT